MFYLKRFPGGIHPGRDSKKYSEHEPITAAPLLDSYTVILAENAGKPPVCLVKPGDTVKRNQLIAKASGFVSANLHAPAAGTVQALVKIPGANGQPVDAVVIKTDPADEAVEPMPEIDWRNAEPEVLKERIACAGIVGMGGAAFPSAVKLSPPPDKKLRCIILNGAECEPYLTADHRLMLEKSEQILTGAAIFGRAAGVSDVFIAVEANKPDAIAALSARAEAFGVRIITLPAAYPQGSEKQLIYAVTGRKVPSGGLPADTGCVVQNVATAEAVRAAVVDGVPLTTRVVTISGDAAAHPGNWLMRIGTPFIKAVEIAGGVKYEPAKFISGGPMMGFAQRDFSSSVQKNTSGLLLLGPETVYQYDSSPCIRCGRCLEVCPMRLAPGPLSMQIECEKFDLAADNHVMDCLECGSCAYVCPARRPLVQHFRRAKNEIRRAAARRKAAEK